MREITTVNALEKAKDSYSQYGKEVAMGRAYPCVYDGMKLVYKRAIYSMTKHSPRRKIKVTSLTGPCLDYHPHPESVPEVITQLGSDDCKLKLLDTQGNFGGKGVDHAAFRYIEGMLSDLAIKIFTEGYEYTTYVPGEVEKDEPLALPTYLPLCFINGAYGIPSGMKTLRIPELNILQIIDYYIEKLKHKDIEYVPADKFIPHPNLETNIVSSVEDWNNIMKTGNGSIITIPTIEMSSNKRVITIKDSIDIKLIDKVRKILDREIVLDKIDVRDETTSRIEIVVERAPNRQINMDEVYNKLKKKLRSSESYNMAFFDEDYIYDDEANFELVAKKNLSYLIDTHHNRIKIQLEDLSKKLLILQIIEKIKKDKLVNKFTQLSYEDTIKLLVDTYKIDQDIATKVIQKPISYLTKEHLNEIKDIEDKIKSLENDRSDIYEFLIKKYTELKKELSKILKNKYIETKFIK